MPPSLRNTLLAASAPTKLSFKRKLDFLARTSSNTQHTRTSNMNTFSATTMPSIPNFMSAAALVALSLAPLANAHSWVEQYQVIADNGSYIGDPGYSRGYVARTDEGYNGFSMNYLVQPGGYVAMKYLENGHVTLPWNQLGKTPGTGTVFVYGTTQPSENEKIADVLHWNSDGTGGDGRGFLLTAQNFDDGRCHQINCGNISTDRQMLFPNHVAQQPGSSVESWCETDLQIPKSQPLGTLTTYWVWQWTTEANSDCTYPDGKDEYYTTCADFNIVDTTNEQIAADNKTHLLVQENPQSVAVSDFKSRKAFTTSPPVIMISGTKTVGLKTSASSDFASACAAGQTPGAKVDIPLSCDPVTVFSGAPASSIEQEYSQAMTTADLKAGMVTEDAAAAVSKTAPTSVPTSSHDAPSSSSGLLSSPAVQAAIATVTDMTTKTTSVTLTTTLTMSDVVTATAYPSESSSGSSSSSDVETDSDTKSGAATGDGIVFQTLTTMAASGSSSLPSANASSGSIAARHVAQHARDAARHHARHFVAV
ncbi:hypothetical protein D0862_11419 [Hortaea werneckii]|uniref:DUF7492 domain-containing protein n=1 Tax=Hortaea werneckii TaxID=91943 RepID=A0A3M7F6K4_HORWE|nr:hypothetical protein D0862_11419 [Hortaea werneckii]